VNEFLNQTVTMAHVIGWLIGWAIGVIIIRIMGI